MGRTSSQSLSCTRFSVVVPSSSQPESRTPCSDKRADRFASDARRRPGWWRE